MDSLSKTALVIPSLNPDEKLRRTVLDAMAAGFSTVILVNDGSRPDCIPLFDELGELPGCTVLHHPENRGKGEGLKTAFRWFLEHSDGLCGVVTADGDGQHTPADIRACADRMEQTGSVIFGCRDFSLPNVPRRSRNGNRLTSFVFLTGCGLRLSDTQTGLRAIPTAYVRTFVSTPGSRFEYETRMLLDMKRDRIPYEEVSIETVYLDGNSGTHFHPVRDSLMIYGQILKFMSASLLSTGFEWVISFFLFWLLAKSTVPARAHIYIAGAVARLCSSVLNLLLNRAIVFGKNRPFGKTALCYYAVCLPQMVVTILLTRALSVLCSATLPAVNTLLLALSSTVIFLLSFCIQKKWVFR